MSSSSPSSAGLQLIPLSTQDEQNSLWRRIYTASNAVVLYNPTSHALAVRNDAANVGGPPHPPREELATGRCPYCQQPLPTEASSEAVEGASRSSRAPNYFHLLSLANEASSRPPTRPSSPERQPQSNAFPTESIAQGYFSTFFREEYRLGMGANGSVYLCQHVLNGNTLGHFAVKKIAIGDSPTYLTKLLREVRLLETLHHPNIINYHHAWLESCQFSSFGPAVPTLHILMQWAEGGSLEEFISTRMGRALNSGRPGPYPLDLDDPDSQPSSGSEDIRSRSARIKAFRKRQQLSSQERREHDRRKHKRATAVHLFSALEVKDIFSDVVNGLGFLHAKSVLHLDLKPLNVLLTWDEGCLIPRAMLSDFGTAQDMLSSHIRSGNTGTLEYCAPESVYRDPSGELRPIDSRADMWSLGMILHKMVFFNLPFEETTGEEGDFDRLEQEIMRYPGFKSHPELIASLKRRGLPRSLSVLLESLLNLSPFLRPNCEQIILAIHEGKLDPLLRDHQAEEQMVSLVPARKHQEQSDITVDIPSPQRKNISTNGNPPAISYVNTEEPHPTESGEDSETPTPGGSTSRKRRAGSVSKSPGSLQSEETLRGDPNNRGRGGSHRKEKGKGKEKEKIPLGFLRSSSSILQPRLRLLGSPTSPNPELDTIPSFQDIPQISEEVTQVLKTFLVLLKVLSLWLFYSRSRPTDDSSLPLTTILSAALVDLWFKSWKVSLYLFSLHLGLLSWFLSRT